MSLHPMLKPVEVTTLGGLRCQVYTGSLSELEIVQRNLDHESRDYVIERVTGGPFHGQHQVIDVISPTSLECREIGLADLMYVKVSERDWRPVSSVTLGTCFEIKWIGRAMDLSDLRTYLRLRAFFYFKFGRTYSSTLMQLEDGCVQVALVEMAGSNTPLRNCLGMKWVLS